MQLDRSQLIKAIKFLKHAIMVSNRLDPLGHVHVKIEGDVCQLTASNHECGKRVILTKPQQLTHEKPYEPEPFQQYVIDKATLEAFEVLCTKHKQIFERAAKIDHSLKLIEIEPTKLTSSQTDIDYLQPIFEKKENQYPNLDVLFFANKEFVKDMKVNPLVVLDALKEFNNHVDVSFSGVNGPVYMATEDLTYQAFFMPVTVKKSDG